jgi:hypothetical protein
MTHGPLGVGVEDPFRGEPVRETGALRPWLGSQRPERAGSGPERRVPASFARRRGPGVRPPTPVRRSVPHFAQVGDLIASEPGVFALEATPFQKVPEGEAHARAPERNDPKSEAHGHDPKRSDPEGEAHGRAPERNDPECEAHGRDQEHNDPKSEAHGRTPERSDPKSEAHGRAQERNDPKSEAHGRTPERSDLPTDARCPPDFDSDPDPDPDPILDMVTSDSTGRLRARKPGTPDASSGSLPKSSVGAVRFSWVVSPTGRGHHP